MVATSAMVHASPAAALVVASQLAAGSSSQGAASAGSTSSQQQQGQGQSQAQQQQQTETVVNQAALELLRRLPGVTDSNWRGLVGGFSSLAELAGASRERLAALMGGERPARMLHDFLHAPCPVR
jgi:ERCC4-type nuclease